MKVISILNHKGGVGKTTFTGSTAQALALTGFRVLAIDNDSQHNLSSLLGVGTKSPNIYDFYTSERADAPKALLRSVRKTDINNLHIITSGKDLCDASANNPFQLRESMEQCRFERFYDFILIDNAPGMDLLQANAVNASHEIYVPTELRQFAVDGLREMEQVLGTRYPDGAKITRIIPNFYKDIKRHNTFIAVLNQLFPGRITSTFIPVDNVFDEVVTEGKILFLHRLYSKGAAVYLKLIEELFSLDDETIWEQVSGKRKEHISKEARERFYQRKGVVNNGNS
ncbi:Chromosome (plasmid) partitioning protein ParA [Chitinispirillum alkaliphilum]|nr:Chromosome (plasmid) partitioning protein ParA [Chitinispirillum alkaliphilum]